MVAIHRPALPAPRRFLKQKQGWLALLGGGAILVGAMAFQVNQLSDAAGRSYDINALTRERAAKQAANHELESEVARLSSLAYVDLDARLRLGLQPATRKLYVTVNQPLPEKQTLPTRYLPPVREEAEQAGDPAWRRALRVLPFF